MLYSGLDVDWLPVNDFVKALTVARRINQQCGRKNVKVIVHRNYFVVVDHTWERND